MNELQKKDIEFTSIIKQKVDFLIQLIDKQDLNNYIKSVVQFSFDSNKFFNDSKPWELKKTNPDQMNSIIYSTVEQIKNRHFTISPMPISTNKILDIINCEKNDRNLDGIKANKKLNSEKELGKIEILFKKIENDN